MVPGRKTVVRMVNGRAGRTTGLGRKARTGCNGAKVGDPGNTQTKIGIGKATAGPPPGRKAGKGCNGRKVGDPADPAGNTYTT